MIKRQMEPVEIYQKVFIQDDYGNELDEWEKIDETYMAINFVSINQQLTDIRYKEATNVGLTNYKFMDNKEPYKIVTDNAEYQVLSVNNIPRYTVIILKEVI